MTINELYQYRGIKAEIAYIKERLCKISLLSSPQLKKLPPRGRTDNPTEQAAIKLDTLKEQYQKKLNELLEKEKEINDFIECVDDSELSAYIVAKFINGKTDQEIADKIGYSRTAMYMRLKKYLEI